MIVSPQEPARCEADDENQNRCLSYPHDDITSSLNRGTISAELRIGSFWIEISTHSLGDGPGTFIRTTIAISISSGRSFALQAYFTKSPTFTDNLQEVYIIFGDITMPPQDSNDWRDFNMVNHLKNNAYGVPIRLRHQITDLH